MADPTPQPPPNSPVPVPASGPKPLAGVAAAAAERNPPKAPAKPAPAVPPNKGGRRSTEEEARAWLASKGLRAIPAADAPTAPLVAEPPPPLDPRFVKDSAKALVAGYSEARAEWVESAIAGLGLPKETAQKVIALARVKDGSATTVVECSPAVIESLGIDSRKFPLAVGALALIFDTLQFTSCLAMLRRLKAEQEQPKPAPRPAPNEPRP